MNDSSQVQQQINAAVKKIQELPTPLDIKDYQISSLLWSSAELQKRTLPKPEDFLKSVQLASDAGFTIEDMCKLRKNKALLYYDTRVTHPFAEFSKPELFVKEIQHRQTKYNKLPVDMNTETSTKRTLSTGLVQEPIDVEGYIDRFTRTKKLREVTSQDQQRNDAIVTSVFGINNPAIKDAKEYIHTLFQLNEPIDIKLVESLLQKSPQLRTALKTIQAEVHVSPYTELPVTPAAPITSEKTPKRRSSKKKPVEMDL